MKTEYGPIPTETLMCQSEKPNCKAWDDRNNKTLTKKWVEITEDPSTWPEMNRLLIARITSNVKQENNVCQLAVAQSLADSLQKYGREFLKFYELKGVFWRESIQSFEIIEPVGYGIANVSHWMYVG